MRYFDGFNIERATELSDLKHGEYKCTHCNKIIQESQVITDIRYTRIAKNGINFCSSSCKKESNNDYDRRVSYY